MGDQPEPQRWPEVSHLCWPAATISCAAASSLADDDLLMPGEPGPWGTRRWGSRRRYSSPPRPRWDVPTVSLPPWAAAAGAGAPHGRARVGTWPQQSGGIHGAGG